MMSHNNGKFYVNSSPSRLKSNILVLAANDTLDFYNCIVEVSGAKWSSF